MIEQESFQQRPMRANCKQVKKIGQCSLKCQDYSTNKTNKFFSLRREPCPNIILPITFSNKE